jgi:perosamine synthetase
MKKQSIPPLKVIFEPHDRKDILSRIDECLRTGFIAQGKNVQEFEESFAFQVGAKYAVAVSSGGAAIETAMQILSVSGKEVLVPTNTFFATAVGVLLAGGKVRLVDADCQTFGVSLATLQAARTAKTCGVIVVHIGGIITSEIIEIREWCNSEGLWLFEDCAHAHGSSFGGINAGRFGIMGAYSFFATKVITSGEGGMLITDDEQLAESARLFRDYGKSNQWVSFSASLGANRRMSEICAAVGVVHLNKLSDFVVDRTRVASIYTEVLHSIPQVQVVFPPNTTNSWYKYIVLLPKGISRETVQLKLAEMGVRLAGGVYDLPLHRQPVFKESNSRFAIAEDICSRHICLPLYYSMKREEIDYVVEALQLTLRQIQVLC